MNPWMTPTQIIDRAKADLLEGDPHIKWIEQLAYAYISGALEHTVATEAMRALYFKALGSYARVED